MSQATQTSEAAPAVGHEVPWTTLLATCIALIILTWLTVAATWFDLGALNLWIALIIATIKAALVVLFFMHLKYDRPFNVIVLVGALLFVLLFVGLTLTDTVVYQPELIPPTMPEYAPAIQRATP